MPDINDPADTTSIAPSTSRALVTESSSLVRRGLALAEALLSRQDAEGYYKSGREKERQDKYLQAVEDFTHAIESDPDFADAYSMRAWCFGHLKERQKQLQDRDAVVRLRPHDDVAYVHRAMCHEILCNYEEALRDYTRAIELAPEKAIDRYRMRGELFRELGKYQEAIDDFTRISAYSLRGHIFCELGKYQEAIDDFTRASAYLSRGQVHYHLGHLEEAINDYTREIAQETYAAGWDIEPSYWRGLAYEDLGRYQDAIQDYSHVIELNRKYRGEDGGRYYDSAYWLRGVAYHKLNMVAEAFDDYRQAAHLGK